jgi:hypothetical protein
MPAEILAIGQTRLPTKLEPQGSSFDFHDCIVGGLCHCGLAAIWGFALLMS